MPTSFHESADQHRWEFHGTAITHVTFDPASVRLGAWTLEATFELRIGNVFQLVVDGHAIILDTSLPAVTLAPALQLLGQTLASVTVERSGVLRLETAHGSSLLVQPHPLYEAWELSGTMIGDTSYICMPGGGSPWG